MSSRDATWLKCMSSLRLMLSKRTSVVMGADMPHPVCLYARNIMRKREERCRSKIRRSRQPLRRATPDKNSYFTNPSKSTHSSAIQHLSYYKLQMIVRRLFGDRHIVRMRLVQRRPADPNELRSL